MTVSVENATAGEASRSSIFIRLQNRHRFSLYHLIVKAKGIEYLYAWLDKHPDVCPAVMTLVDDAHREGVLCDHIGGIVDYFGLQGKVDIE